MAIWDKVPEGMRANHTGAEMASYLALLGGQVENPKALALTVMTTSLEPKCFLTTRMNSVTAIPKIILVHSLGNYVATLGQADDLHGHSFAFTGEQVGNQLPSALLEPPAGASTTLVRRDATTPSQDAVAEGPLCPSGRGSATDAQHHYWHKQAGGAHVHDPTDVGSVLY
jgi:hypothetical protein